MAAQDIAAPVEVNDEANDSGYEASDTASDLTSVKSGAYHFRQENGRTYPNFSPHCYPFPNDEREQDRLDFQHHIIYELLGQRLYLSPVEEKQHVLDLGTGTGIWAIDFADRHPHTMVRGIDLSPIQPRLIPPNCEFVVDDFNMPWENKQYDFIFGRLLIGSITDSRQFLANAYRSLKPGGWLELQDVCTPVSDDNTISPESAYGNWVATFRHAMTLGGYDPDLAVKFERKMRKEGFTNISTKMFKLPQNGWPKDKRLKKLGWYNMVNVYDGIHGFSVRLFTQHLGFSKEEVEVTLVDVRKDMRKKGTHAYWP